MRSDFINKRLINRRRQTPTSQPTLVDGEIILIPSFDTFIWHSSVPGNDRWSNALEVDEQSQAKFSSQLPIGLLNPWNDYNDQGSGGLLPPPGPSTTLAVRTPTRIVMGFDLSGVPTAANITEATLMLTVSSSENWADTPQLRSSIEQRTAQSPRVEFTKEGSYYRVSPILPPPKTREEMLARLERDLEIYASGAPSKDDPKPVQPSTPPGFTLGFPIEIYDPEIPGILWWDDETEVDGWSPEGWYLPCTRQQDNGNVHPKYPISPILIPCENEVPDIYNGRCPDYVIEDLNRFGEIYRGNGSRWWYRDARGRWWFLDDWIHGVNNTSNPDKFILPAWIPYVPGLGVPIGGNGSLGEWFQDETLQPFLTPWWPEVVNDDIEYFPDGISRPARWNQDDPDFRRNPDLWWKNFRYAPPGFVAKPDAYPCPPTRTPPEIA